MKTDRRAVPTKTRTPSASERPARTNGPRQRMQLGPEGEGVLAEQGSAERSAEDLGGDETQFVGAAARALAVLNAFRAGDSPLGNAELTERTNLPKATVSRLTYTLARCGFLSYNPRFRVYELGPSALALGNVALSSVDIRRVARPLMQELVKHANFNVGLGTLDQHLMVYTDVCEGDSLVGVRLFAGSRIPIVTSAMGRAYLAGVSASEREALLKSLRPHYGSEWVGLAKGVEKAVREVEARGFCMSAGEWHKDINGVAAPIRSRVGGRVYAVNLGGPAYLVPEKLLQEELGAQVAELAVRIESALSPKPAELPGVQRRKRS